jgi:DNA helicase HerA-like ATPase
MSLHERLTCNRYFFEVSGGDRMFVEHDLADGEATLQERRDASQPCSRILGHVVACDGARATIAAEAAGDGGEMNAFWAVGKLISISLPNSRIVALVYAIAKPDRVWNPDGINPIEVMAELLGEIRDIGPGGAPVFDRGITVYPHIGAIAHRIRASDLEAIYQLSGRKAATIGHLSQDADIKARVAIDDVLSRHFALVGTTGVGKSTAAALLLGKAVEARADLRVLIFDPHNEFSAAFPGRAITVDTDTLDLPFWLFRLEELQEVLYRGRDPVPAEIELLRDLIPLAKISYRNPATTTLFRRGSDSSAITADTPVPYRINDLVRLIDERMGQLDAKIDRPAYRGLKVRIESVISDPRYRFMFGSRLIEDTLHEAIGRIFRIPHEGRPITCLQLAGLPSEVVNAVCSVVARLAFDLALWSEGQLRLLVVCEEAHRYMPADPRLGFAPTRHALARIAKEGRKYGCYLGVVTQRPGELDPTILSQCSTVFAMRLANERDQEIIRSAIADSSASTLAFLSAMGQREAIAFGEGVATTMRMRFEMVDQAHLPGSVAKRAALPDETDADNIDLNAIVDRMRQIGRPRQEEQAAEALVESSQPPLSLAEQLARRKAEEEALFGKPAIPRTPRGYPDY